MLTPQPTKPSAATKITATPTLSPREIADCYARVFTNFAYSPPTTGRQFLEELKIPNVLTPAHRQALLRSTPAKEER